MAQQTKSRSSAKTRSSTKSKSRNSKPRNSTRSRNGSSQASKPMVAELAAKAKPQAEKVGSKVSSVASKVKTPLVAGGAALAGLAGGVALKSRTEHRRPVGKLRTRSLPKVDFDKLTDMAHRMRSIGEQVGDLADAADKTRKKHK